MLCFSFFNFSERRRSQNVESKQGWEKSASLTEMPKRFTCGDLKLATDGFNEQMKLGAGGFAVVYAGILKISKDKTRVAVKHFTESDSQGDAKSFLTKAKIRGSIHHFNVVKLVGFCVEKKKRLLVYEYMSHGSLDKWIYKGESPQSHSLDWSTRKKIILHVAKGLSYLHENCHAKITHADVKPSNILLDEEFNPKLSDLTFLVEERTPEIRGVSGYLAPERLTGRSNVTEKADVYSFGLVMLEVMFQRRDIGFSGSCQVNYSSLTGFVRAKLEEDRLSEAVEECCGDEEEMRRDYEEVEKMMKLAIWCLTIDPDTRPSMSTMVNVLEGAMCLEPDFIDSSFAQHLTWSNINPADYSSLSYSSFSSAASE